jgi:hypothetical protein
VTTLDDVSLHRLELMLTGSGPSRPGCDGLDEDGCGLEAVARAVWDGSCDHIPAETMLCAGHRDELEDAVAARAYWPCPSCRKLASVRIEPLR